MSILREKMLVQELEEAKERALQAERAARWWNDSCIMWRERWGKEHSEKKKLLEEVRMLTGRNRALITQFQRTHTENLSLRALTKETEVVRNYHQIKSLDHEVEPEEGKQVARVEPIVEGVQFAKTLKNDSFSTTTTSNSEFNQDEFFPNGTELMFENRLETFTDVSELSEDYQSVARAKILNDNIDDVTSKHREMCRFYLAEESIPSLQDELKDLKRFIENLESCSSLETEDDAKTSIFNSLLERVESYFVECDNYVREAKRNTGDVIAQSTKPQLQAFNNGQRGTNIDRQTQTSQQATGEMEERLRSVTFSATTAPCSASFTPSFESADRCTSVDVVVTELRDNIQRLQEENSKEWALREQCGSELCSVKRELRQAEDTIKELREEAVRRESLRHEAKSLKLLNEELDNKSKELIELKATCTKIKKSLDNRIQEVAHEKLRTSQYEGEVKKLRIKVEQFRKDLLGAEERNDSQSNQIRRLQRNLQEEQQLSESLQLQINQTSTRLKYQSRGGSYG